MTTAAKPCSREMALSRMRALSKITDAKYQLGTGNFNKASYNAKLGLTVPAGFAKEYDCAGAAMCEAYMITRHDPGFAAGKVPPDYRDQNDIDDDHNTNSAIEDALTKQEVYELVLEGPMLPGDLVMWATITLYDKDDGEKHVFIGHVLMASYVPAGWKPEDGFYKCRFLQCCGGNGRKPAVIETDGSSIDRHNAVWPKKAHRAFIVRVKQR